MSATPHLESDRRRVARAVLIAMLWVAASWPSCVAAKPTGSPANMADDAELNDVHFTSDTIGWVVGDRGVILSTRDGGSHWRRSTAPIEATLRCVYFTDELHGWIVGGWIEPYRHASHGVVLRTIDGGKRWTPSPSNTLPALKGIRMLDAQHGWAIGDASPLYPSGVFKTKDGGRTWTTMPSGSSRGLLSGDFVSRNRGVVAGADGQLKLVTGTEIIPTRTPDLGGRPLSRVRLDDRQGGWLVGAGGLALTTRDGGLSWHRPLGPLPLAALSADFKASAVVGDSVWLAGEPGTFVYHSPDRGQTWRAFPTGNRLPIRSLHFATSKLGWAVGALGGIMHTRDGGQSWSQQRLGGERLAVWMVSAEASAVPTDLIAARCCGDGYLGRSTLLFGQGEPNAISASLGDRLHESVIAAGGSGATACWRFPIENRAIATSSAPARRMLDRATDGHGQEELEAYLVQQIRMWRPAVIVTDDRTSSPFAALTAEQIATAVLLAADPTRYNEQITVQGLEAHRVQSVFYLAKDGRIKIETSKLLANIGSSVHDYASYARGLLDTGLRSRPDWVALRAGARSGRPAVRLFDGVTGVEPGRGARRKPGPPLLTNLAQLHKMIQKSRTTRALLNRGQQGGNNANYNLLVGQLDDLTTGVDSRAAGEIIFELAQTLRSRGQHDLAADVLQRLIQKHPNSPLWAPAASWLIQYYASAEMQHLSKRHSKLVVTEGAARITGEAKMVRANPFSDPQAGVKPASFTAPINTSHQTLKEASAEVSKRRAKQAWELAQLVQQTRPNLYEDPQLRFAVANAQRELGVGRSSDSALRRMADPDAAGGWRETAQAELWLTHLKGRPPKPVQPCFRTATKPVLDGKLNDRVWQAAQSLDLSQGETSGDGTNLTRVWLAFDNSHLYLAAVCTTPQDSQADSPNTGGQTQNSASVLRQRDTDLSRRDRLEFYLDIDRDYVCYYRFQIDDRGWANEDCFGVKSWNPKWHIARRSIDNAWVVEVAIPLDELTSADSVREQVWAFGVQRVQPDVGLQSWTKPAGVAERPEGFGLLRFEMAR